MNESGTVLLVEDNLKLLSLNRRILEEAGHRTLAARNLTEARAYLKTAAPDVVVLDIMLPDGNGVDFLAEIREACDAPVLFLTAKTEKEDKLTGLRAGGSDYITKPYDIDELRERVSAFLRLARQRRRPPDRIVFGSLALDLISNRAFVNGGDILLTQKEFALLLVLAQNENAVLGVENLYEKVWGATADGDVRTVVKYQISNLRRKIKYSGYTVVAVRGNGYCFETE
ncbi:MAG: response regulator transcription factor [Oscillospiraceae bacterium]|nr:response regulator transcription factor [Oscillospiraceae bacterium]